VALNGCTFVFAEELDVVAAEPVKGFSVAVWVARKPNFSSPSTASKMGPAHMGPIFRAWEVAGKLIDHPQLVQPTARLDCSTFEIGQSTV
jgi:hypothetical protein